MGGAGGTEVFAFLHRAHRAVDGTGLSGRRRAVRRDGRHVQRDAAGQHEAEQPERPAARTSSTKWGSSLCRVHPRKMTEPVMIPKTARQARPKRQHHRPGMQASENQVVKGDPEAQDDGEQDQGHQHQDPVAGRYPLAAAIRGQGVDVLLALLEIVVRVGPVPIQLSPPQMDVAQVLGQPADIGVLAPQGVDPLLFGPARPPRGVPVPVPVALGCFPLRLPPVRQVLCAHRRPRAARTAQWSR